MHLHDVWCAWHVHCGSDTQGFHVAVASEPGQQLCWHGMVQSVLQFSSALRPGVSVRYTKWGFAAALLTHEDTCIIQNEVLLFYEMRFSCSSANP